MKSDVLNLIERVIVIKWCFVLLLIVSQHCAAKLTVVTENFAPAQYLDANNNLVGDAADIVRLVLDNAGIDYSISVNDWSMTYNIALRDPQTCIFSISRSPERESSFVWFAKLAQFDTNFYSLKSKGIVLTSLDQAKQYRIAVLKDNYSHHYLLSQGFKENENLMLFNSFDNIFKIIRARSSSIDLVVIPAQRINHEQSHLLNELQLEPLMPINVSQAPLYFACNKNLPNKLKRQLSAAFALYESQL